MGTDGAAQLAAHFETNPPAAVTEVHEEDGHGFTGSPGLALGLDPGHKASTEYSVQQAVEDVDGASDGQLLTYNTSDQAEKSTITSGSAGASSWPVAGQVWARGYRQAGLSSIAEEAANSPAQDSQDISTEGSQNNQNALPSIIDEAADDVTAEGIPTMQVWSK